MDDEISLQHRTIGNKDKQNHCQNVPNASDTFRMEHVYKMSNINLKTSYVSASVAQ